MKITVIPTSSNYISFEGIQSYSIINGFLVMDKEIEDANVWYNVNEIEFFRVEPDDEATE
jgi:hypothetical protein